MTVDPDARRVDVYWVGQVEPKAQKILDNAPSGVTVRVHETARYTLFEMLAAVERITPLPVERSSTDWMILAAGPEPDGSGIWIEYSGNGVSEEIAQVVTAVTGVGVTSVDVGEEMQPAARWNGYAPWEGGGGYWLPNSICSTSFPATSKATGAKYLLTAYHCVHGRGSISVTNDAQTIGTLYTGSGYRKPDIDAALLRPDVQSISPRVYYGTWSTSSYETIGAVGGSVVDAWACTDGANSGIHCMKVVESNFSTYFPYTGEYVHGLVRGTSSGSGAQVVVVGGDSGGPVVYPLDGSSKFRAMGTILGGTGNGACPPMKVAVDASQCYTTAYWVGSVTLSNEMGMTFATG